MKQLVLALSLFLLALPLSAHASTAYGSLNNFDVVNDTGEPCHGFEIEIEDIHCRDITYTYDWNHYGTPRISEDNSDPLHPRVTIRYESAKNPDGSWAAYTAVPTGPIAPTDGHQFTNPNVNFGGEHFGVGFYGAPTVVRYFWLVDDGTGSLVRGAPVNIATPTFVYYPPFNANPAQVQAAIEPPDPPEIPVMEFGEASWVKEIRTETHNNHQVELRDLVTDDPEDPNDENWANGEPEEVEIEWQLLQTEFNAGDGGANGELVGAPEDLPDGDEIITRRYEFFKYVGPLDPETGEARCDKVGPDGVHGEGIKIIDGVEIDFSTVVVVGDYIGAQMAGFDAAGQIGLIDHLQDGEVDVPYAERSIVIGGAAPILTTTSGALPDGMTFDTVTGILSGTPLVSGLFSFTVHAMDASGGDVTNTYSLTIADGFIEPPPHSSVTTSASPADGGSTSGDGDYENGTLVTVVAAANPGYTFVNWTESGTEVSASPAYEFTIDANRDLVANFAPIAYAITTSSAPAAGGTTSGGGVFNHGSAVTVIAAANARYNFVSWTENGVVVSYTPNYSFTASADRDLVANFASAPANSTLSWLKIFSPVIGGARTVGVFTLSAPAPAGGASVSLVSANPSVLRVPRSVLVPAGQRWAFFVASTSKVKAATRVTVTARLNGSQKSASVRVIPFK